MPLVSVIIPNYNQSKLIGKCIDSVLNQNCKDIEIIVVDDGSTDRSVDIIKEYVNKHNNVILLEQPNQNASIARNNGITRAKGEYLYFLDSDDVVYKDGLTKLVGAANEYNADIALGNMLEIDIDDSIIKEDIFFKDTHVSKEYSELINSLPAPSNKLFRTDFIKREMIYFGNVRIGQDLNFFLKTIISSSCTVCIPECIYGWRHTPNSVTHAMDFHIFDIVYSFTDVKKYAERHGYMDDYDNYIVPHEFFTYYRQMDKQRHFNSFREKKLVVDYFIQHIDHLGDISECKGFPMYKEDYKNYKIKRFLKCIYISKIYSIKR